MFSSRIFNFNSFVNRILEAENTSVAGLVDEMVGSLVSYYLNCYSYINKLGDGDSQTSQALSKLAQTKLGDKPELMRSMLTDSKSSVIPKYRGPEVAEAWSKAALECVKGLETAIQKVGEDTQAQSQINSSLANIINSYAGGIEKADKQDSAAAILDKAGISESEDMVFESLFKGKFSQIKEISKVIAIVRGDIMANIESSGFTSVYKTYLNELDSLNKEIGELVGKKRQEINSDRLEEIRNRLFEIPSEISQKMSDELSKSEANKDLVPFYDNAVKLGGIANELYKEYIIRKADAERDSEESNKVEKLTIEDDISPDEVGLSYNQKVYDFQQLVVNKFSNVKGIAETQAFKKMASFGKGGVDGKFGPYTQIIVKALKSGFDLEDTTPDITQQLVDEIDSLDSNTITESFGYTKKWDNFLKTFEGFDVTKFKEVADSEVKSVAKPKKSAPAADKGTSDSERENILKTRYAADYKKNPKDFDGVLNGKKFARIYFENKANKDLSDLCLFFYDGTYIQYEWNPNSSKIVGKEMSRGTWKFEKRSGDTEKSIYLIPEKGSTKRVGNIDRKKIIGLYKDITQETGMYGGINADEEKIANLFGKLSNSSEYYALKDLVNQSYELNKNKKDYKKLGIEKPSFYNFQDMINKVYDSAFDKADANLLVNNLNKIGVKAKIKQSGSGNFAGITMP
jgi:hypothetical protein